MTRLEVTDCIMVCVWAACAVIVVSPTTAGMLARVAIAVPFAWAGVIDVDTYYQIADWTAF